ncbi:MAG TPA: AAA family ATPase, partial [Pirellulaceae bacterium]
PHAIVESGQIIKIFDPSYHEPVHRKRDGLLAVQEHDPRWIKIRRPTVVVGGEMTMDHLEIRHDPVSNVSEAPLQLKSNCGCLVIDDFGRQRAAPDELLNRWIIPLENRHDFLTLTTGKKIQVPFDQLILFSTNLDPNKLVDEAFLRRIPYKIEVTDPEETEFHQLFRLTANAMGCDYRPDSVEYLLNRHYRRANRALRRCHPRDLLRQVRNYCVYAGRPLEMLPEYFDRVVPSYFTNVLKPATPGAAS